MKEQKNVFAGRDWTPLEEDGKVTLLIIGAGLGIKLSYINFRQRIKE